MTGPDTLGYDISNEIVDSSSDTTEDLEGEIVKAIETQIGEQTNLAEETLENLNQEQLSSFLAKEYFADGAKSYGEIMNSKYLNFSLRAALQMIGDTQTGKFTIDGKASPADVTDLDNNKTIDEWLKSRGGINNEPNEDMVKFLQQIVGVTVDGKPGAQTLWGVINKLGYSGANVIAEQVNTLYEGNETFQAMSIGKISNGGKEYKYDQIKIVNSADGADGTYKIEFNENGTLKTPGLKIIEGNWIVIDGTDNSGGDDGSQEKADDNNTEVSKESLNGAVLILNEKRKEINSNLKKIINDNKYDAVKQNFLSYNSFDENQIKIEGLDTQYINISLNIKIDGRRTPKDLKVKLNDILSGGNIDMVKLNSKMESEIKNWNIIENAKKIKLSFNDIFDDSYKTNTKLIDFWKANHLDTVPIFSYSYIEGNTLKFELPPIRSGVSYSGLDFANIRDYEKINSYSFVLDTNDNSIDIDKLKTDLAQKIKSELNIN